MDLWDQHLQLQEDRRRGRHRRQNPSFSSSLLDAVYRSIDESNGEEQAILYRSKKKNQIEEEEDDDRSKKFVVVRRTSMADFDRKARNVRDRDEYRKLMSSSSSSSESRCNVRDRDDFKKLMNSSSSSSESSSGGGFSSSESESRSTSSYTLQKPRPIRTEKSQFGDGIEISICNNQKPKHENSFTKTKSKALKIYGDLKKAKQQPISPGGRLASFLNSIFNGGTPKKQRFTDSAKQTESESSESKSKSKSPTCSSASSFSRSCLSKTPSNTEKLINNGGTKRSVRFCPVSVILDEDSRPCGHKSLRDELKLMADSTTLRNVLRNSHCRAEEGSEDLMKLYNKKINGDLYINRDESEEEEDDEDDAVSCSSSDLFELDNLSSIGIERYCEELPVYETTHFRTNRAIANGLIL